MQVSRGDVVMVDWFFSDRTGSKLRPAVVAQADFLNSLIDDTVVLAITRTSRGAPSTEVLVDPAVENRSGLRFVSVVSCNNFLTADQSLIRRFLGRLSSTAMQRVDACLKTALQLT